MPADPSKEPPADLRSMARSLFGIFNSLVSEGFSESQALAILGTMLAASIQKPPS